VPFQETSTGSGLLPREVSAEKSEVHGGPCGESSTIPRLVYLPGNSLSFFGGDMKINRDHHFLRPFMAVQVFRSLRFADQRKNRLQFPLLDSFPKCRQRSFIKTCQLIISPIQQMEVVSLEKDRFWIIWRSVMG